MSHRFLLLALAAACAAVVGARALAPAPPSAAGVLGRGPTIVLVHGLGSGAADWLPVARRLARDHRVVLVDLPGHGQSDMPAPFSLERAVEALDAALVRESAAPCVLVGHSLGGLVATAEVLAHPGRARGLVLVETALRPQVGPDERAALLAALDRDYSGLMRSVYGAFGRDSAQGEALYRQVAALDPAMVKPWVRLALSTDLSRAAVRLDLPVLAVLAPRSWPQGEPWPLTAAALGYASAPRLRAERVPDAGHFVMLDQPEALARLIERFAADPAGTLVAVR